MVKLQGRKHMKLFVKCFGSLWRKILSEVIYFYVSVPAWWFFFVCFFHGYGFNNV